MVGTNRIDALSFFSTVLGGKKVSNERARREQV